jgi:hypothetical protein
MHRLVLFVCIGVLLAGCAVSAFAQMASPLEPILNSQLLIGRPAAFDEMAKSVNNEIANTKPGLRLDYLNEKRAHLRKTILEYIQAPVCAYTKSKSLLFTYRDVELFEIDISKIHSTLDLIGSIQKQEKDFKENRVAEINDAMYDKNMKKSLAQTNTEQHQAFNAALLLTLPDLRGDGKNPAWADTSGATLNAMLVALIADRVCISLDQAIPELPEMTDGNTEASIDSVVTLINKYLNLQTDKVREIVIGALNQAEKELDEAIGKVNTFLITGNAGLAVVESKGDFSAGVAATYVWRDVSAGVFVGHQMNPAVGKKDAADSEKKDVSHSLTGITFNLRCSSKFQASAIGAKLIGENYSKAFEYGIAFNYLIYRGYSAGLGYFWQKSAENLKYTEQSTAGLWLTPLADGYPSVFVGLIAPGSSRPCDFFKDKTMRPVVQLSYPITGN